MKFRTLSKPLLLVTLTSLAGAVHSGEKISVAGLFKDAAVLIIDGKHRMLRAGQTSPEGVTLHSADSKEAVIEIDGEKQTYPLGVHIGGAMPAAQSTKVHLYPTRNNMYTAVGSINGFPVNLIVDTGATLVSMNSIEAKRLGLNYRLIGKPATSSTASGLARIYVVRLARVKVGDIVLKDVQGAVHEGAFPKQILLGMSFLGRLDMRRQGQILELEKKY